VKSEESNGRVKKEEGRDDLPGRLYLGLSLHKQINARST